jgi:hypothetical protein
MEKLRIFRLLAVAVITCVVASQAMAVPSLWNTGVDAGGVALAPGQVDPHYQLVAVPAGMPMPAIACGVGNGWMSEPAGSAWIGSVLASTNSLPGVYAYELTFNLDHSDLFLNDGSDRGISILGKWATDDTGKILLNGTDTGIARTGWGAWAALEAFEISNHSLFVEGSNVLRFEVTNLLTPAPGVDPTGLLVSDLTAWQQTVVPVPGAVVLVGLGTFVVGFIRRKGIL